MDNIELNQKNKFKSLAEEIICCGMKENKLMEKFRYKEGENFDSVKKALGKSFENDTEKKFERQVGYLSKYLDDILLLKSDN